MLQLLIGVAKIEKDIMSLENVIMTAIKEEMKAKDQIALAALRDVKCEV